jgi:citronellyl-CoA synthetase
MVQSDNKRTQKLLSFSEYLTGWLKVAWRLPKNYLTVRKVYKVGTDNRESWGSMLEEAAARFPDNIAVKSVEADLTYRQYNAMTNRYANYFIAQGLTKGDTVAVFLESRPELLAIYNANAKVGIINSMINFNLRQEALIHCLTMNKAKSFIVGEEVWPAFEAVLSDLNLTADQKVYFIPDQGDLKTPAPCIDLNEAVKTTPDTNPPTTKTVKPADWLAYVFTSGTTGLPKSAIVPHGRTVRSRYSNGKIVLNMQPDDTLYLPLPFFHTNALALSWPAVLANGSAVAIRRKFSVTHFWSDVRKYDATVWCYIGELCRYLMNKPIKPDDAKNPLKKIIGNGLRPDIWKDFKKRFGIPYVYEIYGAAESNLYFVNRFNFNNTVGSCQLPHAIVRYDADEETPVRKTDGFLERINKGETGLLLGEISESNPFTGYTDAQATESKILRDVFVKGDAWFNTGDLVQDIGFKHIRFVDRLGDTFRWKGENVSTTEVEKVANTFLNVALSTAYGVLMPGGDGRAGMLAIIPTDTQNDFNVTGLAAHLQAALPAYAVPRFVRINKDFEYTPTHKIKKLSLKTQGFNPDEVKDLVYVLLPDQDQYQPLTAEIHTKIKANAFRF